MQIHVSDRRRVCGLVASLEGSVAVISITDPGEPTVDIDCAAILQLQFHDLNLIWPQFTEVTYFDTEIAHEIVAFVEANKEVNHMVVHCEAGIARSPAIAAAISEYLGQYHTYFHSHVPNTMVYCILRIAFGFSHKSA